MKQRVYLVYILILCIGVYNCQPANFDPAQLLAIQNLDSSLSQVWNIANLCSGDINLECDATNTVLTKLAFNEPPSKTTVSNSDLFVLKNISILSISNNIVVDNGFWDGLDVMTSLTNLNFRILYEMPTRFNKLPPSLESLNILEVYLLFPESLFTETPYVKNMKIGTLNSGNNSNVLPASISSPSNLVQLDYSTSNLQLISGTNFDKLTSLSVYMRGSGQVLFDSFDTFKAVETLNLQLDNTLSPTPFPVSLSNIPTLKNLQIYDGFVYSLGASVIDFSTSTKLSRVSFRQFGFLRQLVYPGIKTIVQPDNNGGTSLVISFSDVDLNLINIFSNTFVLIEYSNIYNSQPMGSYEQLSALTYSSVIFQNDTTIPDDACKLREYINVLETNVENIPSCFLCDWGLNQIGDNIFRGNTLLPQYTQQCPNFQLITTTLTSKTDGQMQEIQGVDLGWEIYKEDGSQLMYTEVVIANQVFKVLTPTGTGLNKQWPLKFHYKANPSVTTSYITINYDPPVVNSVNGYSGNMLIMYGQNFGTDLQVASLTIAGQPVTISNIYHSSINTANDVVPYYNNLVFSAKLVIDSQEYSWIQRPNGSVSSLTKPYPVLYSGGGVFVLKGQYLTFDTTIMNLTIAGIPITRISNPSPTSIYFIYDPIVAGNYSMVFNLDTLHISDYIQVSDTPPCKVVHGTCIGERPVCFSGYCGPDCSSIPANLTEPLPMDLTYPKTSSNTSYSIPYEGNNTLFSYTIKPLGIREVTSSGQTIHTYNVTDYSLLMEFPRYYNGTIFNPSTALSVIVWYENQTYDSTTSQDFLQSTVRYQLVVMDYVFASPDNHLEYDIQVTLQNDKPNDKSSCTYYETAVDPTADNYEYHKLKINNADLFYRDFLVCTNGGDPKSTGCVSRTKVTKSYNQIEMIISKTIPYIAAGNSILDMNFNVYIDEKSAQQEVNPICYSSTQPPVTTEPPPLTQTPVVTKTPEQPKCPGDPVCNGHGTCNSHYKCDCTDGWSGTACDGIPSVIVPPETNPQKPETNVPQDEIAIHVSIVSIREITYKGEFVKEHIISNWSLVQSKNDQYQTLHYNTTLDGTNTNVDVEILYFYQDTSIEYAGSTSIKKQGTLKYSANITEYQYANNLNLLQVLFLSQAESISDFTDSCTVKEVTVNDETSSVENIYIQVNDHTFMGTFSDLAVVDGRNRLVSNVIVPSNITDSNTKSNILVAITAPHHNNYIYIDPDFSLLISYGKPSDKEGSICSESKSKLSKAKIAGIVIGGVCFLGIVVAITIYAIKFNYDKKQLKLSLQKRLSAMSK
ncbi:EGF-like domain-containing protein [Tieghemostelium lacteum]|uniref:EGF-like domain-containing protein n=1 Tax=Tieghemostelium lacteum TaxID=361077 RepID=A0A152A7E1_TIELA|nr:EGF-like domain-containing protein [Tieghemostelium lacteum]|eukprot:KYR02150.1 EGF-like domain-containing protein [Tieghemostelium lacteum]